MVGTISAYKELKHNPPGVSLTGQLEQLRQAAPGPKGPVVPGKEPGLHSGDRGKPWMVFRLSQGPYAAAPAQRQEARKAQGEFTGVLAGLMVAGSSAPEG